MKLYDLQLTDGTVAVLDIEDAHAVTGVSWHNDGRYPYRLAKDDAGGWAKIYLHRQIAQTPEGMHTHHRNGDRFDCRQRNLQVVTPEEHDRIHQVERWSRPPDGDFKGITQVNGKWQAQIPVGDRMIYLGIYDTPEEAAVVYDAAVIAYRAGVGHRNLV